MRVTLVNMPFANWARPSFALSQLQTLLDRTFGGEVRTRVLNLNADVAEYLGVEFYEALTDDMTHLYSGLGEWLFRGVAFPDEADNAEAYFARYYPGLRNRAWRERVQDVRGGLSDHLAELVVRHGLADGDVLGFTSMFAQTTAGAAAARLARRANPDIVTVMGGANCEAPMGNVLVERLTALDYVFSGPALHSFPDFVRALLDDDPAAAEAVPGILSRRTNRRPGVRAAVGRDRQITDVVLPDYKNFRRTIEAHPELVREGSSEVMLFFETSRGCWWGERSHCTFCGLNGQGMNYRSLPADAAVELFENLFETGSWCTTYYCTDNVMPKHYPRDVFARLRTPPGASIYYEVKLPLSREDLRLMSRAGVTRVQPGIESLSSGTLKLMRKGINAFQNIQFLKNCLEFRIDPDWNLLVGFPGEEAPVFEKYALDLPLLGHLPPPQGTFLVRFDRFSPYFVDRESYGLDLHPMDFYGMVFPFSPAELADLAYFFVDQSPGNYSMAAHEAIGPLMGLVEQWQQQYRGGAVLHVHQEDGGWRLEDGRRTTTPVSYRLDEAMIDLLRRLESPQRPQALGRDWPGGPDDLDIRLEVLRSMGVLFEEDGRLLGLATGVPRDGEVGASEEEPQVRHVVTLALGPTRGQDAPARSPEGPQ